MKKLLLLVALTLAFSFTALAQGTSTSGTQTGTETTTTKTTKKSKKSASDTGAATDTSAKKGAKESSMTGCLAKDASGSGYTLTNGRYKKGVAVKSSEDLSAHVGHKVKLTGMWEKPSAGESMKSFNATKLDHIADTCGTAAAGEKGKGKKAKAATETSANPK